MLIRHIHRLVVVVAIMSCSLGCAVSTQMARRSLPHPVSASAVTSVVKESVFCIQDIKCVDLARSPGAFLQGIENPCDRRLVLNAIECIPQKYAKHVAYADVDQKSMLVCFGVQSPASLFTSVARIFIVSSSENGSRVLCESEVYGITDDEEEIQDIYDVRFSHNGKYVVWRTMYTLGFYSLGDRRNVHVVDYAESVGDFMYIRIGYVRDVPVYQLVGSNTSSPWIKVECQD